MRLTVIIPTTNGPVQVVRITRLSRLPLSQVVTVDDFVPNPGLTRRYHALTDPAGPLRGLIGLDNMRFELCLDRLPEMGRSWELPVAIAHWVLDRGHELESDGAEMIIWASGVVRPGRDIADEDYHLAPKLDASRSVLEQLVPGARIVFLLPHAGKTEIEAFRRAFPDAEIAGVEDVDAAIAVLERHIVGIEGEEPRSDRPRKWRWRSLAVASFAASLLGVGAVSLLTISGTNRTLAPRPAVVDGQAEDPTLASGANDVAPPIAFVADAPTDGTGDTGVTPMDASATSGLPDSGAAMQPAPPSDGAPVAAADRPAPTLLLVEHRAMPGGSCIEVLLQQSAGEREEHASVSGEFSASPVDGLCAISFEMPGAPAAAQLVLPDVFLSQVIPSDRNGPTGFSGSEGPYFRLIYPPAPLTYRFSLVGAGENDPVSFGDMRRSW